MSYLCEFSYLDALLSLTYKQRPTPNNSYHVGTSCLHLLRTDC